MSDGLEMEHVPAGELAERIDALRRKVQQKASRVRTEGTLIKYRRDFAAFEAWCAHYTFSPLPASPGVVAGYATELSEPPDGTKPYAASTIQRKMAAITLAHTAAGYDNPCADQIVRDILAACRRDLGVAKAQKRAVTTGDIVAAVEAMDLARTQAVRDRALLLVGFAAGLRRSELAALEVEDIEDATDGVVVVVRRSKRDQEARGARIAVVYGKTPRTCPVRALRAWLAQAGITEGAVFRRVDRSGNPGGKPLSAASVALIVKRHMAPLGFDPDKYAGHSLRRGMATTASRNGAPDRTIQRTTRHASPATLAPYIEDGQLWHDPASGYLGL